MIPSAAGNVVVEGIEILRARPAAIEIEANAVGELANCRDIADGHIETAHARIAANAWKGIGNGWRSTHDSESRRSDCCVEPRVLRPAVRLQAQRRRYD